MIGKRKFSNPRYNPYFASGWEYKVYISISTWNGKKQPTYQGSSIVEKIDLPVQKVKWLLKTYVT